MHSRALFFLQACIVAVIGVIHVSALQHSLYWHYIWLDVPVHFLGGLWVALAGAWLLAYRHLPVTYAWILSTVVIVGIGWEVFEVAAGVPIENSFVFDTSLDMFMDICGGVLGAVIARRLLAA